MEVFQFSPNLFVTVRQKCCSGNEEVEEFKRR